MKNEYLTKREKQIAELVAWGASQKEIASTLFIDNDTVANHLKSIYRKLNISKATELSAWYFCFHFHIPLTLSPLKRQIGALLLLIILIPSNIITQTNTFARARTTTLTIRTQRKTETYN